MAKLLIFNKPFNVLSQFTDAQGRTTLSQYIGLPDVYVAGRLDYDSEGLLLLTDDGQLQHRISHPNHKMMKTYWVQVEGEVDDVALDRLRTGVALNDGITRPAKARRMAEPEGLWLRHPPIRERKSIPVSWIELCISEGRNRQVRRMTAAVGYPTLRLIRYAIGDWSLDQVAPGEYKVLEVSAPVDKEKARVTKKRHSRKVVR